MIDALDLDFTLHPAQSVEIVAKKLNEVIAVVNSLMDLATAIDGDPVNVETKTDGQAAGSTPQGTCETCSKTS